MPNWCENRMVVSGPEKAVAAFLEAAKKTHPDGTVAQLSLDALVPMPKALAGPEFPFGKTPEEIEAWRQETAAREAENQKTYGHKDWYSWRVQHWGTKWDVDASAEFEILPARKSDHTRAEIRFDTAWAPPTDALKTAAPSHPEVRIKLTYEEPGCGFQGHLVLKGEEELEDACWQMQAEPDDEEDDG